MGPANAPQVLRKAPEICCFLCQPHLVHQVHCLNESQGEKVVKTVKSRPAIEHKREAQLVGHKEKHQSKRERLRAAIDVTLFLPDA